ncbi:MAG TPA: hypothetical protein VGR95_01260 [Thermoanaerobaculia bacterium]|jgi:hypothetical protein|nr:hypothetical protein [Thermoanaerobaculia bacterium]
MADQLPSEHTYSGDVVNVETHHEESDVNVRALIWFMVIFIVFAAVTHVGVYLLYRFFRNMERGVAANAPLSAVAMPQGADVPPTPRLQPFPNRMPNNDVVPPTRSTPVTDMIDMRESENQRLGTYGWVDQQHGVVHIPIEQAKKLALQSGVYQVNPGTQPPSNPVPQAPTHQ